MTSLLYPHAVRQDRTGGPRPSSANTRNAPGRPHGVREGLARRASTATMRKRSAPPSRGAHAVRPSPAATRPRVRKRRWRARADRATRSSVLRSPALARSRPAPAPLPCRHYRGRATRPRRPVSPPPPHRVPRPPRPVHRTIAAHDPASSAARRAQARPRVRRGNAPRRQRSRPGAARGVPGRKRPPDVRALRRAPAGTPRVRRPDRSCFRRARRWRGGSARYPCATLGRRAMRAPVSRAQSPIRRRPARTVRSSAARPDVPAPWPAPVRRGSAPRRARRAAPMLSLARADRGHWSCKPLCVSRLHAPGRGRVASSLQDRIARPSRILSQSRANPSVSNSGNRCRFTSK